MADSAPPELAHALLQRHHNQAGRAPGDIPPQRSDLAEATKRLEKVMARMRLMDIEAASLDSGAKGGAE